MFVRPQLRLAQLPDFDRLVSILFQIFSFAPKPPSAVLRVKSREASRWTYRQKKIYQAFDGKYCHHTGQKAGHIGIVNARLCPRFAPYPAAPLDGHRPYSRSQFLTLRIAKPTLHSQGLREHLADSQETSIGNDDEVA